MVYDATAQTLAIKAIGTVESNLNYVSINYNDPITIGFMQWYGTRAAALLNRIRTDNAASWVGIPTSLTDDMDAYPATQTNFWTNRYLMRAEGEALKPVLNNNKPIQNAQAIEDLDDYVYAAERAGMDKDVNTEAMLFFFVAYHQSPRRALGILASSGPDSDIDRLYAATLNEPVLSRYRTRYTTARDIIKSGDISGVEDLPDPTTPDAPVGGDSGGDILERLQGDIRYIASVGDHLHIQLRDGQRLITYPNGSGLWVTRQDASTGADVPPPTDNPDPDAPPGSSGAQATRAALVQWMLDRLDRYAYGQGPSRLKPEQNMYTDCSALLNFCYQEVAGINIGTYTGDQYQRGTAVAQGSGTLDESLLLPGDLVFFDWSGGRSTVDHVDMYIGNGNVCGHGGPDKGPDVEAMAPRIANAVKYYVRRHVN